MIGGESLERVKRLGGTKSTSLTIHNIAATCVCFAETCELINAGMSFI